MEKKKVLLAIAIALIFALFVGYGIEVFHDAPKMNDYCPENVYEIDNEEECINSGARWQSHDNNEAKPVVKGNCQNKQECYTNYELIFAGHDKIVFIVSIIVGILAIVTGIILKKDDLLMAKKDLDITKNIFNLFNEKVNKININ